RFPLWFEPSHKSDEGIFAAVGRVMVEGRRPYVDAWDHKPPLIFALYALTQRVPGPAIGPVRVLAGLWAAAPAVAVALLVARLDGRRAARAAALALSVALALPFAEGHLALTELFAAMPCAW